MRLPGLQALFHGIQTHHRHLPLPIRVQSLECASNRLRLGSAYVDTDYVIVHLNGKPIYPEYLKETAISEKELPFLFGSFLFSLFAILFSLNRNCRFQ